MSESNQYDAIVIGGGFAGVTAARDLGKQGRSVLLLEARARIGGRTWTKPSRELDQSIEMGGTWIRREHQPHMKAELERYGIGVSSSPSPEEYAWDLDGEIIKGFPIPFEELQGLESALYELKRNAGRIELGKPLSSALADLEISFEDWLDQQELAPKSRDLLAALAEVNFGARTEEVSFLNALWWLAGESNSPWAFFASTPEKIDGGTGRLINAILEDSSAELQLETPVASIAQGEGGVRVTTATGAIFGAAAAVVAIPANCWEDVEFTPALSPEKQRLAAEKHVSRVLKVWALVENMPDAFALGRRPDAFHTVMTDARIGDGGLCVCFKSDGDEYDYTDPEVVQHHIRRYYPAARVVATDTHDWNTDPYSKGAHFVYRKGQALELKDAVQEGEGRLSFAGGDVASSWVGWTEGAIESGSAAASRTEGLLAE
jgi:monoamine oxidase